MAIYGGKFILGTFNRGNVTKLERVALNFLGLNSLDELKTGDRLAIQTKLDKLTPKIMAALTEDEISASTKAVYNETATEYTANPHTKFIIPELLEFMGMLNNGNLVIDLGCGHGRDSLFMSCSDKVLRTSLINPDKKPLTPIPEKALEVIGIDGSGTLLKIGGENVAKEFRSKKMFLYGMPLLVNHDIHDLRGIERAFGTTEAKGIWSCAALFTHTPAGLLEEVMDGVSRLLMSGGVFFASYTQMGADNRYDKLLLSSTGRIKYFSRPDPLRIFEIAYQYGFRFHKSRQSGFEKAGILITNDLFVSQFFIKN